MPLPLLLASLIALPVVGHATKQRHADALTRYGVGLLKIRAQRPVAALSQFEASAKVGAAAPKAELARLYRDLGRPAAATRLAKEVVAADPSDFVTGRLLGKLLLDANRPADAVTVLTIAAKSPRLVDADRKFAILDDLCRAAIAAEDWSALESASRGILALKPGGADLAEANERLGRSFEARQRFAEAREAYKQSTATGTGQALARRAWLLSGVLLAEGRNAESLEELNKVLQAKPTGVEPYDRLVELLARLNRADRAASTLDTLAEQNPTNRLIPWIAAGALARTDPLAGWARYRELAKSSASPAGATRLARFALSQGRETELLDLLDESAVTARGGRGDDDASGPRDPGGREAVARFRALAEAVKADADGAKLLTPALTDQRLASRHTETRELLALIAERVGRPDVTADILSEGTGGDTIRRIDALFQQHKYSEAVQLCNEFAMRGRRRGPMPAYYVYRRALALHELGRTEAALQSLDDAASSGLDRAAVNLRKAAILTDIGRGTEAITLCETLLTENARPSQHLDARLQIATALAEMGRLVEADAQYDLARDLDPDSALVWNNYGYNLADQGRRLVEAETMLRHAVELSRDERARLGAAEIARGTYLDSLAWVLFRRGKLAESRELFEQAVRTIDGVNDGVVWDHLGDVYARLGELDKARAAWAKAVKLYANTHQGRKNDRLGEAQRKLEGR